jgi:hypothetical protein
MAYLSPGCPSGCPISIIIADPRHFPGKPDRVFPDQKPPLFFDRNALSGIGEIPNNLLISRFFTITGRPLNCTVFSYLKRPVSKNTDLQQKSWRGLAPFPLELPGLCSGPEPLSSEKRSWKTAGPATSPFIKGACLNSGAAHYLACGLV